jgi:uncharacterized protein (DUF2267 family)
MSVHRLSGPEFLPDLEGTTAVTKTTISSFSQAAQHAQQWVNEVAGETDWDGPHAYRLLRAVLHALRDWLPPQEMSDLAAQLPVLIRGVFFEGWRPLNGLAHDRRKAHFIVVVKSEFGFEEEVDFDRAVGAVFHLVDRHVSAGEAEQVRNSMRKALRQLWPAD